MSMKNLTRPITFVLAIALILCMGIWILESQTKILRKTYDEVVLDNRNHYLPCKELPSESNVRQVMEAHQDMIEKIEQINPGFVWVEVDTSTCPGKADIIFSYGTHQDRLQIERIINNNTFYSIPYRLINQ